jgi:hypothetical protein
MASIQEAGRAMEASRAAAGERPDADDDRVTPLNRQRLLVGLGAASVISVAVEVGAIFTMTLGTALACALIAYEAIRFRDTRASVRARAGA